MVDKSPQEIIQSIIGAELYEEERVGEGEGKAKKVPLKPLVTVSRYFGANGTDTARLLAERLGVRLYDQELLDAITKEARADKYLMKQLDERVTGLMDDLINSIFTKKSASKDDFYHYMAKVILGISQQGGVIVGRGAHLLLTGHPAFRLRVEGSLDACAQRVAKRLDLKKKKAERLVEKTNEERAEFVRKMFKNISPDTFYYDMVVNSDTYTPEQVVNLAVAGMKEMGFKLP